VDDVAGEEPFAEFVALRDVGVVRIDLVLYTSERNGRKISMARCQ
jgi:hypothetical protein